MKRLLFLILLSISSMNLLGQIKPMILYYKEGKVLKIFYKNQNKSDVSEKFSDTKVGDTLVLKAEGKETIIFKLTFNLDDSNCDYQAVKFECDSCSLKHLQEVLNDKYYGWKRISQDKYLSHYTFQTEMEIKRINDICIEIIYRFVDKPKAQYNAQYNAL